MDTSFFFKRKCISLILHRLPEIIPKKIFFLLYIQSVCKKETFFFSFNIRFEGFYLNLLNQMIRTVIRKMVKMCIIQNTYLGTFKPNTNNRVVNRMCSFMLHKFITLRVYSFFCCCVCIEEKKSIFFKFVCYLFFSLCWLVFHLIFLNRNLKHVQIDDILSL